MTKLKIEISEGFNIGRTEDEILKAVDFADWHFYPEQNEELQKALENFVRTAMAEAMRNTLVSEPPQIEFESDGNNISVNMPFGLNQNLGTIWLTAPITAMIDEYISDTSADQMDGGDDARRALAKTLRACASQLEAAIGKKVEG